jgi:hypothetical protein
MHKKYRVMNSNQDARYGLGATNSQTIIASILEEVRSVNSVMAPRGSNETSRMTSFICQ